MFYIKIIFICLIGTLLHFVYELSHHNKIVAIFAAVNESVWEHVKICMTPTILWGIYELFVYGFNGTFIISKSLSILTIMVLIPILFYSYTHFTKKSILWIDVICFYVTVICSSLVFKYFNSVESYRYIWVFLGSLLFFIELEAYFILTYKPLKNPIFKDPITHKYGIEGHPCHHKHKH